MHEILKYFILTEIQEQCLFPSDPLNFLARGEYAIGASSSSCYALPCMLLTEVCDQNDTSDRHGLHSIAGTFMPVCGTITEYPSTIFARNLVTAQPAGQGKGYLTVVCPEGSTCGGQQTPLPTLPPHSFAVPLRNGAVTLSGLGPPLATGAWPDNP